MAGPKWLPDPVGRWRRVEPPALPRRTRTHRARTGRARTGLPAIGLLARVALLLGIPLLARVALLARITLLAGITLLARVALLLGVALAWIGLRSRVALFSLLSPPLWMSLLGMRTAVPVLPLTPGIRPNWLIIRRLLGVLPRIRLAGRPRGKRLLARTVLTP